MALAEFEFDLESEIPDGVEIAALILVQVIVTIYNISMVNKFCKTIFKEFIEYFNYWEDTVTGIENHLHKVDRYLREDERRIARLELHVKAHCHSNHHRQQLLDEQGVAIANLAVKACFNAEGINGNETAIQNLEERMDGDSSDDDDSISTLIAPMAPKAPNVYSGDDNKMDY